MGHSRVSDVPPVFTDLSWCTERGQSLTRRSALRIPGPASPLSSRQCDWHKKPLLTLFSVLHEMSSPLSPPSGFWSPNVMLWHRVSNSPAACLLAQRGPVHISSVAILKPRRTWPVRKNSGLLDTQTHTHTHGPVQTHISERVQCCLFSTDLKVNTVGVTQIHTFTQGGPPATECVKCNTLLNHLSPADLKKERGGGDEKHVWRNEENVCHIRGALG